MERNELNTIDTITHRIADSAPNQIPYGLIEHTVRVTWRELQDRAVFSTFLPVLTERLAKQRLFEPAPAPWGQSTA